MQNKYNETILNDVCEKISKEEIIAKLFKNCYDYKCENGKCANTGEKCDPRPCGNCPQIYKANGYIIESVLNAKLDFCEATCPKYYTCNRVAEMNDQLKSINE